MAEPVSDERMVWHGRGFSHPGTARCALCPPPDELTKTEVKGSHELINEAEALARLLRVASGGHLSLAVVRNMGTTLKERQGMGWSEAHEIIDSLARTEGEDHG